METRRKTIEMAEAVGFKVLLLFSEPAASAVYFWWTIINENRYVQCKDNDGATHILLYDYGGGTFDIVYMVVGVDGFINMIASNGCNYTGGENIDRGIVETWMDQIAIEYAGIFIIDR